MSDRARLPLPETAIDAACDALAAQGWAALEDAFPPPLLHRLRAEADALASSGRLRPAGIGRGRGHQARHDLRGDATCWLDDPACGAPARDFLAGMDALRTALNRRLLLGLASMEAHYALYPPGARYTRHLDRFRDDDGRTLSLVLYLNSDWRPGDGGELRLFLPEGERDLPPRFGHAVLFLSDRIEHEVLVTRTPRYSIAGWFRRRPLDPLRA
ncbi:MAG: 2OG-Fe(II) oxygenase [Rehaibacterium terrae]|uniref:2OG-Fe(II) oxygenase n=1 Tax=Rehaibacterium terrae TaxID=1341696 RepID=UPI00391C984B